ncbi:MAG TPA: FlgT C-terminal domain-containing protein [Pyrinomonadaceae bacterium]|nr:FlgT C-terminal domain-containing protein [Pyrinomonadaceae bacterium]
MPRFRNLRTVLFSLACLLTLALPTSAQTPTPTPQILMPTTQQSLRVAGKSRLYCAGYIRYQRLPHMPEIVGAEQEQEQRTFAEGDVVYINAGSQQGIKEGQNFQIIRPRGDVKGVFKQKKGSVGTYVQEVGQLQVFKVRENTSAAQVTFSCDAALLGDLLAPIPDRESPLQRAETNLDQFADPTGKQNGRLIMAKDNREMVTRDDVVYIDLGSEDQVKPGDYLTVYRPLGTGNITRIDNEEIARNRASGFESDRFRGGGFSNQASRAKDSTAFVNAEGRYRYRPITTREVKRHRPDMPRKIVGEIVVIDVQTRTATAIVTRVAGEVHTGDWVEIQ